MVIPIKFNDGLIFRPDNIEVIRGGKSKGFIDEETFTDCLDTFNPSLKLGLINPHVVYYKKHDKREAIVLCKPPQRHNISYEKTIYDIPLGYVYFISALNNGKYYDSYIVTSNKQLKSLDDPVSPLTLGNVDNVFGQICWGSVKHIKRKGDKWDYCYQLFNKFMSSDFNNDMGEPYLPDDMNLETLGELSITEALKLKWGDIVPLSRIINEGIFWEEWEQNNDY